MRRLVCWLLLTGSIARAAEPAAPAYADPKPQRYHLTARASELDARARPHPEIDFVFQDKAGKPQDVENAVVGELYIVRVSNSAGVIDSVAARLTVVVPATIPVIVNQPVSQTVASGSAVTFSVVASGTAPLSYQWRSMA